jgi:hypothetical protein
MMNIIDDYKQLRMIENIKTFKEMEIAYKANLQLCKYQEQQINKLATVLEEIKEFFTNEEWEDDWCVKWLLSKISECEVESE